MRMCDPDITAAADLARRRQLRRRLAVLRDSNPAAYNQATAAGRRPGQRGQLLDDQEMTRLEALLDDLEQRPRWLTEGVLITAGVRETR
jgi:hypothetical protein